MKVGLTGSICCGKSTALSFFKERGAHVLNSDLIVKELIEKDISIQQSLIKHFKTQITNSTGSIDKGRIAHIIFNNSQELLWLENLLHPYVYERWETNIKQFPQSMWVIEIPLLFEKNLKDDFDFTICIFSSLKTQLNRLNLRGLSEEEGKKRMQCQLPLQEKVKHADFVLLNDGTVDFLKKQISLLYKILQIYSFT
jgi:dephospho-CoA kinase